MPLGAPPVVLTAARCGRRAGLLAVLAAGCYSYAPLTTVTPSNAGEVSLVFTDQGRASAARTFGGGMDRVEGKLVASTDTTYVLQVSRVRDIRGGEAKWNGEAVTVPRAWVENTYERHFSRFRTYLVAGAMTAAVTAFIATRALGVGGPTLGTPGGGGGGGAQ
jgi:hypothetical protein